MSRKRENVRQCKAIRQLIDDNKYTKALELIDAIPLEEVGSLDDLYRYAELYEKAERMDKKKEIFYHIYHRTHSRYMLNRLLRLTIRMGDMEEARELYFAYEVAGPITLDTFELRYLLAKAEGEPPERLIQILEELKKEEYTEEWGFRLACLYEKTGQIDKCIQECKDLKLWFGEGKIVDRAMQLLEHCENPAVAEPEELEEVFRLVNNYLDPKGVFLFDFNTVYKYKEVMGDTVIAEDRGECSFIWDNFYYEEERINEYDLTLFIQEDASEDLYRRYQETHYQRGYTLEEMKELVERSGLVFEAAYDAVTHEEPTEKSERIYIVARESGK